MTSHPNWCGTTGGLVSVPFNKSFAQDVLALVPESELCAPGKGKDLGQGVQGYFAHKKHPPPRTL